MEIHFLSRKKEGRMINFFWEKKGCMIYVFRSRSDVNLAAQGEATQMGTGQERRCDEFWCRVYPPAN